jgi:hypothetical protein
VKLRKNIEDTNNYIDNLTYTAHHKHAYILSTNREIEKRGRVVGVDITVQKNKLQKYKRNNKLQTTRTQRKLDLVYRRGKQTNKRTET